MLKTLVLALVAGIALSPSASATTGSLGEPAAQATVVASTIMMGQSAASTCSAAIYSITREMAISNAVDSTLAQEPRCFVKVYVLGDDGKWSYYLQEVKCGEGV